MAESGPISSPHLGKLCPTCRNLFDTWDEIVEELESYFQFGRGGKGSYGLAFHRDAIAWRIEVENGCIFCIRLFDSLKEEARCKVLESRTKGELQVRLCLWALAWARKEERAKRDYQLWVTIKRAGDETRASPQLDGGVTLVPRPADAIESEPELKLAPSTSSDESLAFIKNWIQSCRTDHPQCHTAPHFFRLPTRLIEISTQGLRLWTPNDVFGMLDYVTLSHCWGAMETLKLTKNNIQTLSSKIPVHSLCGTFLDAVLVTIKLGYRYVWIDSMCIIQDDEDDWRRESGLMADVYGNAVVNLAATASKDGLGGLFRERVVSRISKQYVQTKSQQIFEIPDERLYFRCLDQSPLSQRAWVFQERFLARRTIHFTAEQIFCECRRHIACEGAPGGAAVRPADPDDIPFPSERKLGDPEEWREIIQLYSRAKLTYSKDKLIALSGVARQFQSVTGDQYVAGLWKTDLEIYLCWRVESSESLQPIPDPETSVYQAPSWSWASSNQAINWYLYMTPLKNTFSNDALCRLVNFLDIHLEPVGPDPLGQLQAAHLDIETGPLIRGNVIASLLNDFDQPFDNSYQTELDGKTFLLRGEGQVSPDHKIEYESVADSVYFLPLSVDNSGDEVMHYKTGVTMYGLVVTKADCDFPGVFKRFGAWEIIFNVESYSELMGLFLMRPQSLMDESLYQEKFEKEEGGIPRYVITLV
ncbi:HET-domain-containing protein [Mollisia scopiformis]|uniref:HET-domain-containing protein n=1 Tax=Mollisia scopiformis TaxID=149040 RepID=A0A194WUC2_MOLSC|nr:HET-domain-containing protein [Mollisia scopiformis]KUJ11207.1 HET-domain-containing protein [Mollisia scopiformis]